MSEWRCKDCGKTMEEGPCTIPPLRDAVVDAAKALLALHDVYYSGQDRDYEDLQLLEEADETVLNAVRALLAAEGEE